VGRWQSSSTPRRFAPIRRLELLLVLVLTIESANAGLASNFGCGRSALEERACKEFNALEQAALLRAYDLAVSKLDQSCCRTILADFRDPAGRTLQEDLADRGVDSRSSFAALRFFNGNGTAVCQEGGVYAWTRRGSARITVCGTVFARRLHLDPGFGAVILIHEWLHALGLSENPPSSEAISAAVARRCGRWDSVVRCTLRGSSR
jgi:hypothetical protein